MGKNKIIYNGNTLIDLTADTVTADTLLSGYTAHDRSGTLITGTATSGGGSVTQDQDGFIVLPPDGGSTPSVGGLEYETGTITIADQSTPYDITLNNVHSSLPIFFVISQVGTSAYASHMVTASFSLTESIGAPADENYNNSYGVASVVRVTSSGTFNAGGFRLTAPSTNTNEDSTSYPRYWATNSRIRLYASATYQIGGTYEWIAVWAPTT